jgi:hypothetical protein
MVRLGYWDFLYGKFERCPFVTFEATPAPATVAGIGGRGTRAAGTAATSSTW